MSVRWSDGRSDGGGTEFEFLALRPFSLSKISIMMLMKIMMKKMMKKMMMMMMKKKMMKKVMMK